MNQGGSQSVGTVESPRVGLASAADAVTARSAVRSLAVAGIVVALPAVARPDAAPYYLAQGTALLTTAGVLWACRRRLQASTTSRTAFAIACVVAAVSSWLSGGMASAIYHSYAVALAAVAWLVYAPPAAVAVTVGIVSYGGFLVAAQGLGWMPAPWVVHSLWHIWLTTSTAVALLALVQWLDVYRLRDSQAALKQSLSLLQSAFESTADGLLVVDGDGRVTGYNQKFLAVWRVPGGLVETQDDRRMLHMASEQVENPAAFLARVQEIYAQPDAVTFDAIDFKDGRRYERFSQPQVVDGAVVGRVWSFRDVTARTREERRRAELEQQLQHAHTLEALGTLAGGVAHDFNNLLTIIIGGIEHATATSADERTSSLATATGAAHRASALVREIRQFSQPRAAERSVVAVADTIQHALQLLRITLPKNVALAVQMDPTVTMFANPTQVQQVVTNLVLNAGQAIGHTPGQIDIALHEVPGEQVPTSAPEPHAERYAELTVRDTGGGMAVDVMPRIFDPYFTTKTATSGSGLGLAVVNGIVRRHHGTIAVDSTPGTGTTFRVYWPALPPAASTIGAPGDEAAAPRAAPSGTQRHILVVDDEDAIVKVIGDGLRRMGYRVTTATDPRDAFALFAEAPDTFDAVLSDLSMPHLSGADMGRRMLDLRPDTPIALFTGYSAELSPEQARAAGFRAVLNKPMTLAVLAESLHQILPDASRS